MSDHHHARGWQGHSHHVPEERSHEFGIQQIEHAAPRDYPVEHADSLPGSAYAILQTSQLPSSYVQSSVEYQLLSDQAYARSRSLPSVTSWMPQRGHGGSRIYIYFQHPHDFELYPMFDFVVVFGDTTVYATPMKLTQIADGFEYALSVSVPQQSSRVNLLPVRLVVNDSTGGNVGSIDLGSYVFLHPSSSPSTSSSRKRKVSEGSVCAAPVPTKRPSVQRLHDAIGDSPALLGTPTSQQSTPNIPYIESPRAADFVPTSAPARQSSQHLTIPQPRNSESDGGSDRPHRRSPQSHSRPSISSVPRSIPTTIASRTQVKISATVDSENPQLIRTSIIQQRPRAASVGAGQGFNPHALYPDKAVLRVQGNLNLMAKGWTNEELSRRRRLVQFERTQRGSTITTTFSSISPQDRPADGICISCIWWEAKKECYVTSVDTIYLLECLVAVRFTVEEKNRIRRNLEGFHPLTVTKPKSDTDTDDFFKVIMGFTNPRPRNIEKDVKVFPWRILEDALQKIIGKYSASYSSTASTIPSMKPDLMYAPSTKPGSTTKASDLRSSSPVRATQQTKVHRTSTRLNIPQAHSGPLHGYTSEQASITHDARYGIHAPGPDWTYAAYSPATEPPAYVPPNAVPRYAPLITYGPPPDSSDLSSTSQSYQLYGTYYSPSNPP